MILYIYEQFIEMKYVNRLCRKATYNKRVYLP